MTEFNGTWEMSKMKGTRLTTLKDTKMNHIECAIAW